MNKFTKFSRAIIAIAMTLAVCLPSLAHDFEVDGIYYNINNSTANTVAVTYKGASYYEHTGEYSGSVIIPESVSYNGNLYSVISIGKEAFYNCPEVTSITIGNSVKYIGAKAFYNCQALPSITIPDSIASIGDNAFYNCTGLTEVNFNAENCTKMGSNNNSLVFKGCTKLTKLTIGDNIKTIPSYAFSGCTGLTGELVIPNSVTSVGEYAFNSCRELTSVSIGNSVTSIGKSAFSGCGGLTSVSIPGSVISIGDHAFQGCDGMTEVNFNAENCTTMGSYSSPAFNSCTNLTKLTIGDNVKTIPSNAFSGCTGLTGELVIPVSVTSIGGYAFYGTGLTEVNFNAENCTTMGSTTYPVFEYCNNLAKLSIGEKVKTIPSNAFYKCTSLTEVNFNAENCTTMGSYSSPAFNSCTNLTKLTIGDNVKTIPSNAFSGCTGLTGELVIPVSVTSIGEYAFYGTGLTEVNFNAENCTTMESFAFDTSTLTKLTFGDNVKTIPSNAFSGCTGLTGELVIPNSVSSIGKSAFLQCIGLASVSIGNSVTSIGQSAFYECTGLTEVISLNPTPPSCAENVFASESSDIYATAKLIVPEASVSTYKSANVWKRFYNIEAGIDDVTTDKAIATEVARYDVNGRMLSKPTHGINIIKMSDGSTRKEWVK